MKNKGYAKFWGANKVRYGKCASDSVSMTQAGTLSSMEPPQAVKKPTGRIKSERK